MAHFSKDGAETRRMGAGKGKSGGSMLPINMRQAMKQADTRVKRFVKRNID